MDRSNGENVDERPSTAINVIQLSHRRGKHDTPRPICSKRVTLYRKDSDCGYIFFKDRKLNDDMILTVEGGRRKKGKGKIREPDSLALMGKKDSEGKKTDQACRNNGKTANY